MASTQQSPDMQSLSSKAKQALEEVTAKDPSHLKALSSYMAELEKNYARVTALLEQMEGGDDGDDEDDEDPETFDADIIFNTRDWHKGGITGKFRDAPAVEEGDIAEVEVFPVFYPPTYEPLKGVEWDLKPTSRPTKPRTLLVNYGPQLEELKKEPLFRGFKVLVHMGDSDEEDGAQDDESSDGEDNE